MLKKRYSLISASVVVINLMVFVVQIKAFGTTSLADSFFTSILIITAFMAFSAILIEQFVVYYHQVDREAKEGSSLYVSMFFLSIFYGLLFFFILLNFSGAIEILFFSNVDDISKVNIFNILSILFYEMIFWPLIYLNQKMLNARGYYVVSYALNLISSFFFLFAILAYFYGYFTLEEMLIVKVVGVILSSLFSTFYIFKFLDVSVLDVSGFKKRIVLDLVKSSFMMKIGHNLHNFFVLPIFTTFLTSYGTGVLSSFFYAYKGVGILHSIVVGPQVAVCLTAFSKFYPAKNIDGIKSVSNKYYKFSIFYYVFLWLLGYSLLPFFLEVISVDFDYQYLSVFYILLGVWYLLITVESVSVLFIIVSNKYVYFIFVNLLFVLLFLFLTYFMSGYFEVYSVFLAVCIAQLFSLVLYFISAQNIKDDGMCHKL